MPPLYQYECPHCGRTEDIHRSIAERDTAAPKCEHGTQHEAVRMLRIQTPVAVAVSNPAAGPRRGR